MTEYEKMLAGEPACPTDLSAMLKMARGYLLTRRLNKTSMLNQPKRNRIIKKLFGSIDGKPFHIRSPLHVEYGCNIHVGKNFQANYNLIVQDNAPVTIGDNVLLASNIVITTVRHPFCADQRAIHWVPNCLPCGHRGVHIIAKPIVIGNNVWVCAGAIICAGVTIGDNSVIGAGSVVTRDIPPNVLAFGNPCRVVRAITEADRIDMGTGLDAE